MDKVSCRAVTKHDLPSIHCWFINRNFPPPNVDFLPPTGAIAEVDGRSIAAGFLYQTDGGIATISHLVSNKDEGKEIRQNAIDEIIETLSELAKHRGYKIVTCAANFDKMGERFEKLDFEKTDTGVSHFRRILCP